MKLSMDLGRWTTTKAALVIAVALAIGSAVGSAVAVGPSVPAPIKWAGGVDIFGAASNTNSAIFVVPANQNFMLTDMIVSNSSAQTLLHLYSSTDDQCGSVEREKLKAMLIPGNFTIAVTLTTGIGFSAGRYVCFSNSGAVSSLIINARGFLFTPAPAS